MDRRTGMMQAMTFRSASEDETKRLAGRLGQHCKAGDCILLRGELGAGKTVFARGFIQSLAGEQEVVSPTFTLAQTYDTKDGTKLWHFDLYRLERAEEVDEIGLDEALQAGITLVEWPEIAAARFPGHALEVHLTYGPAAEERRITFSGDRWQSRLKEMAA